VQFCYYTVVIWWTNASVHIWSNSSIPRITSNIKSKGQKQKQTQSKA